MMVNLRFVERLFDIPAWQSDWRPAFYVTLESISGFCIPFSSFRHELWPLFAPVNFVFWRVAARVIDAKLILGENAHDWEK